MDRVLYLHVGDGRCGSSSIQRLCADQRAAFRERGLDYPSAEEMGFGPEWAHGGNGRGLALSDDSRAAVEMVADYLSSSPLRRALISAEQLRTTDVERLADLADTLTDREIRLVVVLYLREQREWLVSDWAQGLKSRGLDMPLDQYLLDHAARGFTSPTLAYVGRCQRLSGIFGADRLVVRRFQRDALRGGDVRADLMDLIGVQADDLIAAEPRRNESASLEDAVMLRVFNSLPDRGIFDRRAFLRRSRELSDRNGWSRRRDLYRLAAPATLRATADHYTSANEELRQTFLPDVPAPLFTSAIPEDFEQISEDDCLTAASFELAANFFALVAHRKIGPKRAGRRSGAS